MQEGKLLRSTYATIYSYRNKYQKYEKPKNTQQDPRRISKSHRPQMSR